MIPRRLLNIGIATFLIGLIAWGAMSSMPPIPKFLPFQDKLEHFGAFLVLSLWLTAAIGPKNLMIAAIVAINLAIGLELGQEMLTTTRSGNVADLAASMSGIFTASLFVIAVRTFITEKRRPKDASLFAARA